EGRVEYEGLGRSPPAHADAGLVAGEPDDEAAAHDHLPLAARIPGEAQPRLGEDGLPFDAAAQIAVRGQAHAVREVAGIRHDLADEARAQGVGGGGRARDTIVHRAQIVADAGLADAHRTE